MSQNSEITPVDTKSEYNPEKDPHFISCLDHGFVRLVEVMGTDSSIVQAARVSYGKGTKSVRADRGLIHYLMKHRHTTPFEMVEFKFHCKMPIFVARQWIRHRTANVNEISGRYSIMEDTFWEPSVADLRKQSFTNRQGSTDEHLDEAEAARLVDGFKQEQRESYQNYEKYLAAGIAREIARTNLPVSLYTEWYWKIDLHNLLHFLSLRLDAHAQKEIRIFAEAMAHFVKEYCPIAWEAFEEHMLQGANFSHSDLQIFKEIIQQHNLWDDIEKAKTAYLEKDEASPQRVARELNELKTKLGLNS